MDDELAKILGQVAPPPPTAHLPSAGQKPKDLTLKDVRLMAEEATPEVFRALYEIGMNRRIDEKVRVSALRELLDRGMGKATQQVVHNFEATDVIKRLQQARGTVIDAEYTDE